MTGAVEQADPATVPWRSPALHVVLGTSLMASMGVGLVSPGLPAIKNALAVSDAQAGLVLTVFSLPGIVLAPVMGVLADRFGRRVVLVPCLVGYGLAGGAITVTGSFAVLVGLRFLQGCAASGLIMLSLTLVGDYFDGPRRNAVMGVNTATTTLGVSVFPILGGYLADVRWNLPFVVYTASVLVGAFAFLTLEESLTVRGRLDMAYLRDGVAAVSSFAGLTLYGAVFVTFLVYFGALNTSVPFLLDQSYALASLWIGVILSLPLLTSSVVALLNGRLARYASNRQLIGLGIVGYGLGLAGTWLAGSPAGVTATLLLLGAGHGLLIPPVDTEISGLASDQLRGGVTSLRISVKKVGQTVGPVVFPMAAVLLGYPLLLLLTGLAALLVGAVSVALASR
ncbi:MFS transporter [Halobacteriales archaeon QS_1_68_17]|nr:MAG: MFS transporter [Halobacteriales archaeon QS_1_68_17]